MSKVYEKAYAKINLGLKVGIKRDDGYHNIETLMACVDLWDDISLEDSEDIVIEGMNIPFKDNLIYKVIVLLKDKYNIDKNVKIVINKKIPIGAGLGGGSSNAAATIKGLNRLWDLKLSIKTMEDLGQKIGSDVSFFITGQTSIVKGKGEILNKIDLNLPYKILLVCLPFNISTKIIYENYDYNKRSYFKYRLDKDLFKGLENDLESVYMKLYPDVYELINNVKKDLQGVVNLMSGSGPTVFALYNENKNIDAIIKVIKEKHDFLFFEVKFKNNVLSI